MEMIKSNINEEKEHSTNVSVENSEKLEQNQANIEMQVKIIDNLFSKRF
ncbi:MAG: hypothetical protein ACLVAU_13665 [Ruminococcus sp.]